MLLFIDSGMDSGVFARLSKRLVNAKKGLVNALKIFCPTMINVVDKLHSLFNSAKANDSFEAEQKNI